MPQLAADTPLCPPLNDVSQEELRVLIVNEHFGGKQTSKEAIIVNVLFQQSITAYRTEGKSMEKLQMAKLCKLAAAYEAEHPNGNEHSWDVENVGPTVTHIRRDLQKFFRVRPNLHEVIIRTEPYSNVLDFRPQVSAFDRLWGPYLDRSSSVQILYPEPQFFRDSSYSYVRCPEANSPGDVSRLAHLTPASEQPFNYWSPSHSFVPSGLVQAVTLLLSNILRRSPGAAIATEAIRSNDRIVRPGRSVVVMGTVSTLERIEVMTRQLPAHMFRERKSDSSYVTNAVRFHEPQSGERVIRHDDMQLDSPVRDRPLTKRVLLTRLKNMQGCPRLTIVTGHSRAVEGVAHALCGDSEQTLASLLAKLPSDAPLDDDFQLLLKVSMQIKSGEFTVTSIAPVCGYIGQYVRSFSDVNSDEG